MDETDGWLILGCIVLLALGLAAAGRRLDRVEREAQFLRIVVQTADSRRAD